MSSKHTPGPWVADCRPGRYAEVCTTTEALLRADPEVTERDIANVTLAACAPELLEALVKYEHNCAIDVTECADPEDREKLQEEFDWASALLRKARGGQV
jgi:hypothetical protein